MANPSNMHLPNPFTPMAFLPPDQAYQKVITDYIAVGGLSVLIWDILTHLNSDFKLVTQYQIKLPTIAYLVSRWSTLLYGILLLVFQTAPVVDCVVLMRVICVVFHVTVSSTALLFLLRVRAIFIQNRYISIIFFILWVAVVGGSLSAVLSASGEHIGTTKYCALSNLDALRSAAANIIIAAFDTSVFIAITWYLSNSQVSVHLPSERRFDVFGRFLPAFTRGLLREGQKYYLVAMLANLLVVILNFIPGVPMSYRVTFWGPVIALTNIMACRVFRHTKMGREGRNIPTLSGILFVQPTVQRDGDTKTTTSIVRDDPENPISSNNFHFQAKTGVQLEGVFMNSNAENTIEK